MRLTPRQQQILEVLRQQAADGAPAPSLDGLCGLLGLRSRGSLHKQVSGYGAFGIAHTPKPRCPRRTRSTAFAIKLA